MDIGFIGLGTMGKRMAAHLLQAGHRLFAHGRRAIPTELSTLGAIQCPSPREVAERGEIVILMVPDTPDVEAVLFGPSGVADGLSTGKIVVDMSSISPLATKGFAQRIEALGAFYLDAPVSGGEVGARAASLSILVGGRPEIFARVRPIFELMGKNMAP